MSFNVEVWKTGAEGAVKLFVIRSTQPDANEMAALKADAVGFYRRQYGEWPAAGGDKVTQR